MYFSMSSHFLGFPGFLGRRHVIYFCGHCAPASEAQKPQSYNSLSFYLTTHTHTFSGDSEEGKSGENYSWSGGPAAQVWQRDARSTHYFCILMIYDVNGRRQQELTARRCLFSLRIRFIFICFSNENIGRCLLSEVKSENSVK